jgi:predicted HTH domain antitoxin
MALEIDDDLLRSIGLTPDELRLELAVHLYATGRLTQAQARHLTTLSRLAFEQELGKRKLWPNYTEQDLHDDIATLQLSQPA